MCKANKGEALFISGISAIGNRISAYILWNRDRDGGEILLASEKDIRQLLASGQNKVYGFELTEDGKKAKLKDDINVYRVSGMTYTAIKPLGIVSEIYTLISKGKTGYELLNSRYGRKVYSEAQIQSLLDLGATINGLSKSPTGQIASWFDTGEPAKADPDSKKK
jgi:hypothetical protein